MDSKEPNKNSLVSLSYERKYNFVQTMNNYEIVHGVAPKKPVKNTSPTSVLLRPEDEKLIQEIRSKTGLGTFTEIVRMALRRFAQAEGIGQ